nr:FG-GAP-like repeat-containing protein [uncultured Sphaerochaeta sp.]
MRNRAWCVLGIVFVLSFTFPVAIRADHHSQGACGARLSQGTSVSLSGNEAKAVEGEAVIGLHGLHTYFTPRGLEIIKGPSSESVWNLSLHSTELKRGERRVDLAASHYPCVTGSRVEYRKKMVTEWYEKRSNGLEQGFSIRDKLPGPGLPTLTVSISGNLKPALASDERSIRFTDSYGLTVLSYSALQVVDASGKCLPARFALFKDCLSIIFDDRQAAYPIAIDPIISSAADWSAQETDEADAYLGSAVASAGDVNGDGFEDVIVGAPRWGTIYNLGQAYVYYGTASGLPAVPDWYVDGPGYPKDNSAFGGSLSTAGDVNGDGFDDVIIGASNYGNDGRVYVYHGSASGLADSPAWVTDSEVGANASYGVSVACAGDVNGDGYDDIIVGDPDIPTYQGRAYVYYGSGSGLSASPGWVLNGNIGGDYLGVSVDSAGDVNHDGYDDVIVGAYRYEIGGEQLGAAFVFLGSPAGLQPASPTIAAASDADWVEYGEYMGGGVRTHFGHSVSGAGDIDADGYDDVIIGADWYQNATIGGKVYLFKGSNSGLSHTPFWTKESSIADGKFGEKVAGAGDINADGYDDLAVSAPNYEGVVYAYLGGADPDLPLLFEHQGVNSGDYLGGALEAAGDVNGDGYEDVLFGSRNYDHPESDEGGAWAIYGYGHPIVVGVSPAPEAAGVDPATNLTANFNVAMTGSSLSADSFVLQPAVSADTAGVVSRDTDPIDGQVTYDAETWSATFEPLVPLSPGATFQAKITTAALDLAASGLSEDFSWTFTTSGSSGETYEHTLPAGTSTADYRIVSIPLKPENPDPQIMFGSQIGTYDTSVMRIGTWRGDRQAYREYPFGRNMKPGDAAWFLFRNGRTLSLSGTSTETSVGPMNLTGYAYTIYQGWNQLGNPFLHPVDVNGIIVVDQNEEHEYLTNLANRITQRVFWKWRSGTYVSATSLAVSEGGWIKKLTSGQGTVFFPAQSAAVADGSNRAVPDDLERPPSPPAGLETASGSGAGGCFISVFLPDDEAD